MRTVAVLLITLSITVVGLQRGGQPQQGNRPPAPRLRIIPPEGSTFAPGQRFDMRVEADEVSGAPTEFTFEINGRDEKRTVFGNETFAAYPGVSTPNRPAVAMNTGLMRRNWSFERPGRYVVTATAVQPDGTKLTAKSTIDVAAVSPLENGAKNIILFIGDGMGVAHRTAARIVSKGVVAGRTQGLLEMDQMEANGFVMTSSLDALIPDSSPGAGSFATGNKSQNNWHGVFPDNTGPVTGSVATLDRNPEAARVYLDNPRVENLAEYLQRNRRMSTGVVSTVAVTDSTPGSFSSHSIRYAQNAIAEQMLSSGHSVILGGGGRYFLPSNHPVLKNVVSARIDRRNLVDEFVKMGFTFVTNATELAAAGKSQKLLGLFHGAEMASRYDRMHAKAGINASKEAVGQFPDQPNLEIMTQQAINVLSQNPNGFFLLVEAGSIDREYHRADPYRGIYETIELDKAIGVARAWSRQRGNEQTLIVVTADHETAGLAITGVLDNGRGSVRTFPDYRDADLDGFPDTVRPELSLGFDFPSAYNAPRGQLYFELPRNLRDLNPTTTLAIQPGGFLVGHTATDVFIGARGPGSHLFGAVLDNTEVFFRMLRALDAR